MIHTSDLRPSTGLAGLLDQLQPLLALAYLIARFLLIGFAMGPEAALLVRWSALLLILLFFVATALRMAQPGRWSWLRSHLPRALLALALSGLGVWQWLRPGTPTLLFDGAVLVLAAVQIGVWLQQLSGGRGRVVTARIEPTRELVVSFLLVIILGSLALLAPAATVAGTRLSPLDALFTATSATCVTGLTVADTSAAFTPLGQTIILALIQIGGLGLMSFIAALSFLGGGEVGVRDRFVLGALLSSETSGLIMGVLARVFALTLAVQALGVALLYLPMQEISETPLFAALFHSVSAFCNAGFSNLAGGSIDPLGGNAFPILVILALFIVGGLGFSVLMELGGRMRRRGRRHPLRVHTRIALSTTAILLVGGTFLVLAAEHEHGLRGLDFGEQIRAALFHAASTRTAGFSYAPIAGLAESTLLLFCVLMFVGASPGGTGGGVKTTTFALHVGSLWSTLARRPRVEMFERTIPADLVVRAAAVVIAAAALVVVSVFALCWIERDLAFMELLFEATSAVSTTGLSLGATAKLSAAGKLIIVADMFLGRVGPLTLFLLLGKRHKNARRIYPEESLLVG